MIMLFIMLQKFLKFLICASMERFAYESHLSTSVNMARVAAFQSVHLQIFLKKIAGSFAEKVNGHVSILMVLYMYHQVNFVNIW